ncbi:MAG: virulence-associated E family protein [Oscillospiraceae bacterium]|nr:virulence-associated E family protein [Oscillospiraceae bacterium]
MQFDRQITITVGASRKATVWKPETTMLSAFYNRLGSFSRSTETLTQYREMSKAKQDELKDVGGFVAGTFRGEKRRACDVVGRDVITLDLDNIPAGQTDDILQRLDSLGVGFCVYSTRKHAPEAPRLRVLLPLSRTVTADEYEPIARKAGEIIGRGAPAGRLLPNADAKGSMIDPVSFSAAQMMYFPSCCADSQIVYTYADKPFVDADAMLAMYTDWRDVTQWPGITAQTVPRGKTQKDPTEKTGAVGAFCRVYDVPGAIAAYLPDKYTDAGEGRYTFTGGSTTGGAVLYEGGKFLFSHHATDPASGKLCNAFDLVRLHLYGALDEDAKPDTPTNKLPSFVAMCQTAVQDTAVAQLMNQERYAQAVEMFGGEPNSGLSDSARSVDWMKQMKISPETGKPLKTVENVLTILENDPQLHDIVIFDEFSNRLYVMGKLPWDSSGKRRDWKDADDAGLRCYMEKVYNITGKERITDGFQLYCEMHKTNLVQEFLRGLPAWDGVHRLDTLFIDYLGGADTPYTRAVARKSLCAAVARAMQPGVKYDTMPILVGAQGIGKSTLLRYLGADWFNDSLSTFEGKEACEMIQGSWLIELQELNGLNKSEENAVKQFLSKTDDIYREPYGRRTGRYPRRCVFFGTTNDDEFLRDKTGARRFLPIDCMIRQPSKSVFSDLPGEVPQIWAEALLAWRMGEALYLESAELATMAREAQEQHAVHSAKEGIIRDFLEREIPDNWERLDLAARKRFWEGSLKPVDCTYKKRDRVCAVEIWCEALGGDVRYFRRQDAAEINGILSHLEGWKRCKSNVRFGAIYGTQKGFVRQP